MKRIKVKSKKIKRNGFTLVELMAVVFIIGILVLIAVPQVANVIEKAKIERAKADIKTIETALEMYYLENGAYPEEGNEDNEEVENPLCGDEGFMEVWPVDPWGDKYVYKLNGSGGYIVYSEKLGEPES